MLRLAVWELALPLVWLYRKVHWRRDMRGVPCPGGLDFIALILLVALSLAIGNLLLATETSLGDHLAKLLLGADETRGIPVWAKFTPPDGQSLQAAVKQATDKQARDKIYFYTDFELGVQRLSGGGQQESDPALHAQLLLPHGISIDRNRCLSGLGKDENIPGRFVGPDDPALPGNFKTVASTQGPFVIVFDQAFLRDGCLKVADVKAFHDDVELSLPECPAGSDALACPWRHDRETLMAPLADLRMEDLEYIPLRVRIQVAVPGGPCALCVNWFHFAVWREGWGTSIPPPYLRQTS